MSTTIVHTVVYLSFATQRIKVQDIEEIVAVSRKNNAQRGITGVLFYKDRQFLQLLEGDEATVEHLLQTIQRDPRHSGLCVLIREPLPRIFEHWSMDYVCLNDNNISTRLDAELLAGDWDPLRIANAPLRLRRLLLSFKRSLTTESL